MTPSELLINALVRITVPQAAGKVKLFATYGGITSIYTGATDMAYTLPADKQVQLQIAYVDANGNPATVDGAVVWDTSDASVAHVDSVDPDGMLVMLVPGTKIGNAQVSARADADLGSGVRELVTLLDVTVVGGEAVAGTITPVGEPEPLP